MTKFNLKALDFFEPDKQKKILDYHSKGGLPGLDLGFRCMQNFYTHKQSGVTDWTGFPASGKTYFVLEVLMQLSERYDKRHGLYVPDLGTYYETLAKLVKMYTGLDFESKWHRQISVAELMNRIPQISRDFVIFIKEDYRKPLTPQQVWENAIEYRDKEGRKLDTITIDSWKNMYHDIGNKREDQYLDYILSYRNELAEEGNIHIHTIAHPTKTELTEQKDRNGNKKRRVPDVNDIKGGGAWFANGKNIITVDRPHKETSDVDLYIWKTKPENVGSTGTILEAMFLDVKQGRYKERVSGFECLAFEHEKIVPLTENSSSNRKLEAIEGAKAMKQAKMDIPTESPFNNDLPFTSDGTNFFDK